MQPSHPTLFGLRVNELTCDVDKKGSLELPFLLPYFHRYG